jgi:hypothetical protein
LGKAKSMEVVQPREEKRQDVSYYLYSEDPTVLRRDISFPSHPETPELAGRLGLTYLVDTIYLAKCIWSIQRCNY